MSKTTKLILLTSSDDEFLSKDKSPSLDIDDLDIGDCEPQKKKILRKRSKNKNNFCDSSDDDAQSKASDSEQSLMSISDGWSSSGPRGTTGNKRCALQRLKYKVQKQPSDDINTSPHNSSSRGTKRRRRRDSDDDSDEYNFCDERSNIEAAWKSKDNEYEGYGLETFYRETLGIESASNSDDLIEIMEPMKQKRKLNHDDNAPESMDRNKLKSKLAEKQLKEAFGNVPLSQDLMHKIARYLTLIEISQILVLINHEFCAYFNTDKYWAKLYYALSKETMNKQQMDVIKAYTFKDKSNKLYKRRMLWYYTTIGSCVQAVQYNVFDNVLKRYMEGNNERVFLIKLYLVKECVLMHYNKQYGVNIGEYGIDSAYRIRNEDMNVIMPLRDRSVPDKYKMTDFMKLYERFDGIWRTHNDIFDAFRFIHQFYVEYVLDTRVKENVMDLQYLVNLRQFYEGGNARNIITRLVSDCDIRSSIGGIIDGDGVKDDVIGVTIQSPKVILHKQIGYIMEFINKYNDKGQLQCKLDILRNEMFERNIISKDEEFENVKGTIDLTQFRLTNKRDIVCKR